MKKALNTDSFKLMNKLHFVLVLTSFTYSQNNHTIVCYNDKDSLWHDIYEWYAFKEQTYEMWIESNKLMFFFIGYGKWSDNLENVPNIIVYKLKQRELKERK